MSIAEQIVAKLRDLTPEQQLRIMRLVDALAGRAPADGVRRSPIGLLSDLSLDVSASEIGAARREAWADFPRGDLP